MNRSTIEPSFSSRKRAALLGWLSCLLWLVFGVGNACATFTDPAKVIARDAMRNIYADQAFTLETAAGLFCGNDPVNRHDPLGLDWVNKRITDKYWYVAGHGYLEMTHNQWVWEDGPATPENLLLSLVKGLGEGTRYWGGQKIEEVEALPGLIEEIKANPSEILDELGIHSPTDVLGLVGQSAASKLTTPFETLGNFGHIIEGAHNDWNNPVRGPNYAMESVGSQAGPTVAQAVISYLVKKAASKVGPFAVLTPAQAREKLRKSLGADPYGGLGQAHHIFDVVDHQSPLGKRLQGWGIDLNSAENGVWLPSEPGLNLFASIHNGKSTLKYRAYTQIMLGGAKDRDEALSILRYLKNELQSGHVIINDAGQ